MGNEIGIVRLLRVSLEQRDVDQIDLLHLTLRYKLYYTNLIQYPNIKRLFVEHVNIFHPIYYLPHKLS